MSGINSGAFFASVPQELLKLPQWLVWSYEDVPGKDKPTKRPYCAMDGRRGSSTNRDTWCKAIEALKASAHYDGVGFAVTAANGFVGIDLDHCRDDQTGELDAWARSLVDKMASYTEVTPSRNGVRIWIKGKLPEDKGLRNDRIGIEIYADGRFFTVTGEHLAGTPKEIVERQGELDETLEQFLKRAERGERWTGSSQDGALSDDEVIERASNARNGSGERFRALMDGDTARYGGNASSADQALCNVLAFWTRCDESQIDRIFRRSGLYRDKWDERRGAATYGERTMYSATSTTSEVYEPRVLKMPPSRPGVTQGGNEPVTQGSAALAPIIELDPLHRTDMGNARRLVARHGQDMRYVTTWKSWLVWDGTRWRMDDTQEAVRRAKDTVKAMWRELDGIEGEQERKDFVKWCYASESAKHLANMLVVAQSEPEIAATPRDFDTDKWVLNLLSGTLDLRTGQERAHNRADMITKVAPVHYERGARLALWDEFIEAVTDGSAELMGFLQRAAGYTLTGETGEEKLFFAHGPTRTGKSTFLQALRATLGDYAATADFETFLHNKNRSGPRDDLADLAGARLVVSSEVEEGKRLAEGVVKTITGKEQITARQLYQKAFSYLPQFKLWLAANDAPKVSATDDAIWQRILRVGFNHSFVGREKASVKETLTNPERAGAAILNWALVGCLAWQRDGLGVPEGVTASTAEYRESQDPLKDFLADCCELAPDNWVRASDLRRAYDEWCKASGERFGVGGNKFSEALKRHGCEPDSRRMGNLTARVWNGIRVVAES